MHILCTILMKWKILNLKGTGIWFFLKCAVESIWAFRIHVKWVAVTLVSPSKPYVPLDTYLQLTVINFLHYAGPLANNSKRSCSRNIDNSEGTNCFCRSWHIVKQLNKIWSGSPINILFYESCIYLPLLFFLLLYKTVLTYLLSVVNCHITLLSA